MRILRRGQLLADGYSDDEVRRSLRAGRLLVVRRGSYINSAALPEKPEQRYALRVRATAPDLAPDAVISHASAAAIFGLPLWDVRLDRVHVTRDRRHGGRVDPRLHVHSAVLPPEDLVIVEGLAMTSVARTVADLARSLVFEAAVVVADAALNRELVTHDELAAAIERSARRPGAGAARRVLAFADASSQSPGESRSRVRMQWMGMPMPQLQMPIETRIGICHADFGWPEFRAVGEFDGLIKYGALLRPGQEAAKAVVEEKIREDAIRDEDWRVTRWIWDEIDPFLEVARRIERSFRR
jgi:hypothetical protein